MINLSRRPSDHGGDGGYEHCCRECRISFTLLLHVFGTEKVPEAENKDGDICADCYKPDEPDECRECGGSGFCQTDHHFDIPCHICNPTS